MKFKIKIYNNRTTSPYQCNTMVQPTTHTESSQRGVGVAALWQCNCPYGRDVVCLINSRL